MTPTKMLKSKIIVLISLGIFLFSQASGQMHKAIKIDTDKANERRSESNIVLINTTLLSQVMAKCIENNIQDVQVIFTRLKKKDIPDYIVNHPEAAGFDKELVGKMTILLKIEGDDIDDNMFTNMSQSRQAALTNLISSGGLVKVNRPYGGLTMARAVYLEIGTVCPPPSSCN